LDLVLLGFGLQRKTIQAVLHPESAAV
jgi:hypothetical protein